MSDCIGFSLQIEAQASTRLDLDSGYSFSRALGGHLMVYLLIFGTMVGIYTYETG